MKIRSFGRTFVYGSSIRQQIYAKVPQARPKYDRPVAQKHSTETNRSMQNVPPRCRRTAVTPRCHHPHRAAAPRRIALPPIVPILSLHNPVIQRE